MLARLECRGWLLVVVANGLMVQVLPGVLQDLWIRVPPGRRRAPVSLWEVARLARLVRATGWPWCRHEVPLVQGLPGVPVGYQL